LPAFTPSGTFKNWRSEKNIIEHNGLICIDFDHVQNIENLLHSLKKNKYTYACFKSVSGLGVAWFVKIEATNKEQHLLYFEALATYCFLNYTQIIDISCKNLDRLRFVSHDPNLYFYPNSQAFDLHDVPPSLPKVQRKRPNRHFEKTVEQKLQAVWSYAQNKGYHYVEGQRHIFIVATAGLANQIGIFLEDYLDFMGVRCTDFDNRKAEQVYKKYCTQFNTK